MTTTTTPHAPTSARVRTRALVVLAAVVAAALVWLVAVPVLGVDLAVAMGTEPPAPVGLSAVLLSAALASLAGWALLAVLERSVRRGPAVWTVVAVVVLLASLTPVLLPGETAPASRVVLGLMHVVVAGVVVPGLRATGRRVS